MAKEGLKEEMNLKGILGPLKLAYWSKKQGNKST